ncbi:MAG: hypothetical protein RLZZ09_111 [Pseudomonadota bacterium]
MTSAASLNSIYRQMPPKTLAAMVLNAAVVRDEDTVNRIMAAVPRRTYSCPDIAYQWTRDALETALLTLGMEWWRNIAMQQVCTGGVLRAANEEDYDNLLEWDARHAKWRRAGAVIDAVLHTLCAECGLDEPAIRNWLNLPPKAGMEPEPFDDEQREDFEAMVKNWRQLMAF